MKKATQLDGFEDVLYVYYQFDKQDYLANLIIYDEKGLLVKRILKNSSVAKVGSFMWDGLNEKGALSKVGIYIIKFEVFALNGKSRHYEKACVLATKLN